MIELGVGFHPELSGRDNVYLSTSLLGLSRRQTDRLYPAVVEFAELRDFMDLPVKSYSTGMAMRLGFAVAIHLDAGIYLIDEVLAVGDGSFREKCLERIRWIRRRGHTIVLVSHDLDLVARLCDRACLLHGGAVAALGETGRVLDRYRERSRHAS